MDRDRIEGTGRQLGGRLREWWGRVTGRRSDRVGGKIDQGMGKMQTDYGRLKDELRAEGRREDGAGRGQGLL